jgi:pentatricopeptide repeat protein
MPQVWDDAVANNRCELDCRLCTTLIEVCARKTDTDRALRMYRQMRDAPKDSKLAPSGWWVGWWEVQQAGLPALGQPL